LLAPGNAAGTDREAASAAVSLAAAPAPTAPGSEDTDLDAMPPWLRAAQEEAARSSAGATRNSIAQVEDHLESVYEEMFILRKEISDLKEVLDLLIREIMADLQEENAYLRHELHALHTYLEEEQAKPQAPAQSRDQLFDLLVQEHQRRASDPARAAEGGQAPAAFSFEIVDEWGRSAEDAQALGANVSTLKGIVGVVPRNSGRDALEQLGRDLRSRYAEYDNINIEVFDSQSAAQDFATRQVTSPMHRVLSVSRHRATGRDLILVSENGIMLEVRP